MGWETRGNARYYYRKRREGRRVVSEYTPNEFGSLAATLDAERQAEHEQQRRAERIEHEKIRTMNAVMNQMNELVGVAVNSALIAGGYHRHKGQWRKKRYERQSSDQDRSHKPNT